MKAPPTVYRYERDRERPVLRADVENGGSIRLRDEAMHLPIFLNELPALELVQNCVIGADKVLSAAEHLHYGLLIIVFNSRVESAARRLDRGENLLAQLLSQRRSGLARRQQHEDRQSNNTHHL